MSRRFFLGFLLFLLLSGRFSVADEEFEDIKRLIEEIKKAPPEERYKLMNRLKLKLREINASERNRFLKLLRKELSAGKHKDRVYVERIKEKIKHRAKLRKEFNKNDEMRQRFRNRKVIEKIKERVKRRRNHR